MILMIWAEKGLQITYIPVTKSQRELNENPLRFKLYGKKKIF